ncbi:Glycosyltransferase involved in cell wall bisynthesis [Citreimonas salinaria]|uniref:Glycosyltransferase involved in cell wall bisynthesis n=2 Tax=Citreimonas salinaria TaxID=321339 RepID=A0A1H3N3J2_9RHOB|nr:Glycosyltransferase involved in cell wall bisynthesis [Citreimonas salinaria]
MRAFFMREIVLSFNDLQRNGVDDVQRDVADVCLILEGCYPFVFGGVSSWSHSLIKSLPETTFHIISIQPGGVELKSRYDPLPNITGYTTVVLAGEKRLPKATFRGDKRPAELLRKSLFDASKEDFDHLVELLSPNGRKSAASERDYWNLTRDMYTSLAPATSFQQFFWVWHTLLNSVAEVLSCEAPHARVYHAISTGYAGLLGAAAQKRTGRPLLLTEHGIYTNERTVELMAASALHDSFENDPYLSDPRGDARDVWVRAFECMGILCYERSDRIISLSCSGRTAQIRLGAPAEKTQVIANGIDLHRFKRIELKPPDDRQIVAFIGRVVAIKDVETFIRAMDIVLKSDPDVSGWIVGPEDEEPHYAEKCRQLVSSLGIGDRLKFLGMRDVVQIIGQVDMVVLTSLSEAQPLTLLEAGAAGLPCVASDVGSCREILHGDEGDPPGGYVTELMSPTETATAIRKLLADPAEARAMGATLQARICANYGLHMMREAYSGLYRAHASASTAQDPSEA